MCLLSYFPEGIIPDEARLENGAALNSDGHGWAIATPRNELLTGRSLEADKALEQFMSARRANPAGPAMFHSRFSTGGTISVYNAHPFQVGRDCSTVVAHNGILFSVTKREKRSDTRIFAETIMPKRYQRLDRPNVRTALETYLGGHNKLAVITVNRRYRHQGYVFNERMGIWRDGEWHSNHDCDGIGRVRGTYQPWWTAPEEDVSYAYDKTRGTWTAVPKESGWRPETASLADCAFCGARGSIDLAVLYCSVCRSCADCGDVEEHCLCYIPQDAREAFAAAMEKDA